MMSMANPSAPACAASAPAERDGGAAAPARAGSEEGTASAAILTVQGIAQQMYGRHGEAVESWNSAAQGCPEYPPAHAVRARALAGLGRPDDAVQAFCDAIARDPKFAAAYEDCPYGDAARLLRGRCVGVR